MEGMRPSAGGKDELRSIRTFMDLLSHDINNHIYAATGYLELLETMVRGDEPKERFLRSSMGEVRSIAALLGNLRSLTMLSSEPLAPEPMDIRTRLEIAEGAVRYYLAGRELEVAIDATSPDKCVARADRFLHDVLVQLLSNSIKNDTSPVVVVIARWTALDGSIELVLEDYGKGMNDETKALALTRYSRLVSGGDVQGKGMGLSLVSAVMERYGGSIRLEDRVLGEPSRGLRVILTLPQWGP